MIREIAQYIEDNTTLKIGDDLFVGWRPQDVADTCSVLIETGGEANWWIKDRQDKTIQVISRAKDYYDARDEAYKIYNLLNAGKGLTLPDMGDGVFMINSAEAIQVPQSIGQEEKGRWEFSTNYILRISQV